MMSSGLLQHDVKVQTHMCISLISLFKVPESQAHLDLKSFTVEVLQLGRVFGVSLSGSWDEE